MEKPGKSIGRLCKRMSKWYQFSQFRIFQNDTYEAN